MGPDEIREEIQKAKERETLRRAGTHVYHSTLGVIPIERARQLVDGGAPDRNGRQYQPEHFFGDPETGVVRWSSATMTDGGIPEIGTA